jgi:hypothetical protein
MLLVSNILLFCAFSILLDSQDASKKSGRLNLGRKSELAENQKTSEDTGSPSAASKEERK